MTLAQETALVPPVMRRDSTEICGLAQVRYVNYTGIEITLRARFRLWIYVK